VNDQEQQFAQAVQGVFSTQLGQWLLKELQARTAKPFSKDPYTTAFNCGAQELIQTLSDITKEP
jgi:hypothetical protein